MPGSLVAPPRAPRPNPMTAEQRVAELEGYIASLHHYIRGLRERLEVDAVGAQALLNHLREQCDEEPAQAPAGLHLLARAVRHDLAYGEDGLPTSVWWETTCSCGWSSEPTAYAEEATYLGEVHVGYVTP